MTQKQLVFLIDEDEEFLALQRSLHGEQYEIRDATSVEGAIDLAMRQDRPAATLINREVGESSGFEVYKHMQLHTRHDLACGLMSDSASFKKSQAVSLPGVFAYLKKSASSDAFRAEVTLLEKNLVMQYEMTHDIMTGLLNRYGFQKYGVRELVRAKDDDVPVGCFSLDMDNMKLINDQHGHDEGDAAIKYIARAIRRVAHVMRANDVVSRLGGDEFLLALPGRDLADVDRLVSHLEHGMKKTPFLLKTGKEVLIEITVGTDVLWPHEIVSGSEGIALELLEKKANTNMEAVKRHKKSIQKKQLPLLQAI